MSKSTDSEDSRDGESTDGENSVNNGLDDPPEVEESSSSSTSEDESDEPELEDDSLADIDAIAEDLQEGESEDAEDPESPESDSDSADSTSTSSSTTSSTTSSGRSWGSMYTKGVVKLDEALIDEFGDEDSEPITEGDVQDLELDEAFDEWMAEKTGRPEEIPPGQWVAIGTLLLIGGNVATETDAVSELISQADV